MDADCDQSKITSSQQQPVACRLAFLAPSSSAITSAYMGDPSCTIGYVDGQFGGRCDPRSSNPCKPNQDLYGNTIQTQCTRLANNGDYACLVSAGSICRYPNFPLSTSDPTLENGRCASGRFSHRLLLLFVRLTWNSWKHMRVIQALAERQLVNRRSQLSELVVGPSRIALQYSSGTVPIAIS